MLRKILFMIHSWFIHAHSCYAVGNNIISTRMCMKNHECAWMLRTRNYSWTFVIHSCTFMLRRRQSNPCLRRYKHAIQVSRVEAPVANRVVTKLNTRQLNIGKNVKIFQNKICSRFRGNLERKTPVWEHCSTLARRKTEGEKRDFCTYAMVVCTFLAPIWCPFAVL